MKRLFLFSIILIIGLGGCNFRSGSKVVIPEPKEMALIIADVHLAEATLAQFSAENPSSTHNPFYKEVLQRHGLTKAVFDSAVAFYSSKPDEYEKIYENVLEILTEKELATKALKDTTKVIAKTVLPEIVKFDANNFWVGNRTRVINSNDSTRANSQFEISTDSISGGSLLLTAKFRFTVAKGNESRYKTNLKVDYIDGKMDSVITLVSSKTPFKDQTSSLKLANKKVKRVFGSLITLYPKEAFVGDVSDIRLKWNRPKPVARKRLGLKVTQ